MGKRDAQIIPSVEKPAFYQLPLHTVEPLFQNILYQGESPICVSVKGQVRPFFDGAPGPARVSKAGGICMKAGHFLSCVCVGFWHSYSLQMGFLKRVPCLYKAIVCELPTLYGSRKTSFIAVEVAQVAQT